MDNPKQAFVYRGRNDDELNDDIRNTPEYKTLIVNAQTGEMLDPKDKSQRGYGDARYKGLHPVGQGEIRRKTNMKKQFAALLTALSLLPTLALAQDYHPAGDQGAGKGRVARNLHRPIRAGNGCRY